MQLFVPLVNFILLWFLLLAITNVDPSVWILVTWCLPDVTVALQHIAIYTVLLPRIVIHIVSPDSGGYTPLIFKQFLSREPALVLWGLKQILYLILDCYLLYKFSVNSVTHLLFLKDIYLLYELAINVIRALTDFCSIRVSTIGTNHPIR